MVDLKDERSNPQIWVKAAEGMTVNELKGRSPDYHAVNPATESPVKR